VGLLFGSFFLFLSSHFVDNFVRVIVPFFLSGVLARRGPGAGARVHLAFGNWEFSLSFSFLVRSCLIFPLSSYPDELSCGLHCIALHCIWVCSFVPFFLSGGRPAGKPHWAE
jgi:hypothetical protein